ncbi:MAG: hypothetical protein WDN08_14275 [Rhizomicrobium sp.]
MADGIFSSPGDDGAARAADLWAAAFGRDSGWHIARKIDDLAAWGDPAGAAALRRVQKVLARRDAAVLVKVRTFFAAVLGAIGGARLVPPGRLRPETGQARGR